MVKGEAEMLIRTLVPWEMSSVTGSRAYIGEAQNVLSFQTSSQMVMPSCSCARPKTYCLSPGWK